ncbi:PREDICTED: uncharacterized protein LOC109231488 [Nicotiana attenuata]|uniref:uncharacterized protein LOC109231488 n=1 Tax=Nicotiana attenuata TaxID=49451 RepID=UPI0009054CED|nr:PREDICTED: uncharacterized protein LOC109231488 [Nicotiana attenuata]
MEDRIQSRIDRAFGNYEWIMKWGNVTVEYELPGISDNAPMLLSLGVDQANTRSPFRFFDVWADHKEFTQLVEEAWQQCQDPWLMRGTWRKLKRLRPKLKTLNNREFRNAEQKMEDAREEIKKIQRQIQQKFDDVLQAQERDALQKLKKWSMIEESIMKQKSRDKWIKLRDANTKYFSAVMKERKHRKQIKD